MFTWPFGPLTMQFHISLGFQHTPGFGIGGGSSQGNVAGDPGKSHLWSIGAAWISTKFWAGPCLILVWRVRWAPLGISCEGEWKGASWGGFWVWSL